MYYAFGLLLCQIILKYLGKNAYTCVNYLYSSGKLFEVKSDNVRNTTRDTAM